MSSLNGRVIVISGSSRGIGKAIALRVAADGAHVVILGKTSDPNAKLPGTIHETAEQVEAAGGKALAVQCDVRNDEDIERAIKATVERFGGIDVVINNASAISLTDMPSTNMSKFDLMHRINVRGTFALTKAALPYLRKSKNNPQVLIMSPPLDRPESLDPGWFAHKTAYALSKYGMSIIALGLAEEFKQYEIAVNTLWPATLIATAALQAINSEGSREMARQGRTVDIMADAAYLVLTQSSIKFTGKFVVDEEILKDLGGVRDFNMYRYDKEYTGPLMSDLFIHSKI